MTLAPPTHGTSHDPSHVVLLWHHPTGRPFSTITDAADKLPCAYPLSYLQTFHFRLFHASTLVHTPEELASWTSSRLFPTVTANSPLLVPLSLAASQLGWYEYHYIDPQHDTDPL